MHDVMDVLGRVTQSHEIFRSDLNEALTAIRRDGDRTEVSISDAEWLGSLEPFPNYAALSARNYLPAILIRRWTDHGPGGKSRPGTGEICTFDTDVPEREVVAYVMSRICRNEAEWKRLYVKRAANAYRQIGVTLTEAKVGYTLYGIMDTLGLSGVFVAVTRG